ncbi:hypothetical protein EON65_18140 [archaeon]|nr:MAG: hypothetical protein EON65_18140 [archaeon]
MLCIQADAVRYTGRWSYGHHLWLNYKEIALDLRQRTREIQFKRGLGPNPASEDFDAQQDAMTKTTDLDNVDNEYDDLDLTYQQATTIGLANKVMIQPIAEDLQWIQIEDFVNIFNYIYIVHDISFEKRALCKRFTSQWLPGDYLVGSGGPPVVVFKEPIEEDEDERPPSPSASIDNPSIDKPKEKVVKYKKVAQINDNFTDNPMYPFTITEPTRMYITLYQPDKRWNAQGRLGSNPRGVQSNMFLSRKQRLETVMQYEHGIAFVICRLSGLKMRITEFKLKKMIYTSQLLVFANAVNQVIDIFPGRYVIIPYTHSVLDRALDYAIHIQYYSNHVDFEVEDVIAQRLEDKDVSMADENANNEPEDNELLVVHPDKYKIPSAGSEERKGNQGDGDGGDDGDDVVSVMSYEPVSNVQQAEDMDKDDDGEEDNEDPNEMTTKLLPPPRVYRHPRFEFADDIEEVGVGSLFSEVGSMMTYVRTLKQEVDRLNGTMRSLNRSQSMHSQDN